MENNLLFITFGIFVGILVGIFFAKVTFIKRIRHERSYSIAKSKSVILGEVYEKVLPALPNFPYAPKDMVFIGKGCDYIIFDGLSEGKLREIIFLELKSGSSKMNKNEQMIHDTVQRKYVSFREYWIGSKKN